MAVTERTEIERNAGENCHLLVYRDGDGEGDHFDGFDVPLADCRTVFDALHWIQLHEDPSLSLRHSCLHASCGTCGMRVNGREVLACVCELADLGPEVRVQPLDNLPNRTDVVVEMSPFYDRFPPQHPIIRVSELLPTAQPPDGHDTFVRLEDCIECGLCLSACPIGATDFVGPAALAAASRLLDEPRGSDREEVLDWLSRPEGVWQCTTCMACVEVCPAEIQTVPAIVEMRSSLIERGDVEPMLAQTLQNFAMQGNSYGKSARTRARWTRGLDFEIPDARQEAVDYVWFVGDYASFDERVQRESRRLATILHDAGVSFGLLFEGEHSAGNDVHKVGEEGLFEMLVEHNMKTFGEAKFGAIFTTDPHSLNTLRNEYPCYGLKQPVYHYTELLLQLASEGTIAMRPALVGTRVTYHDPCYLARYNGITDPPRELIRATGAELIEMPRHGTETFCCGAGGGRIWMADAEGAERPSEQRIREAQALGQLDYFVVSCPKDLTMYSAAADVVEGVEFEVVELTTLLQRAIAQQP